MRLSKDLIGKPIVTITDGQIVGNAKDVCLNESLTAMAGIYLGKEGLLRRKSLVISAENVLVFGIDAILINDADAVQSSKTFTEADTWVRLDKLQGREIDTPGGTKIGIVGDVVLDEEGMIKAYALSRVYVDGPINDKRVVYRSAILDSGSNDGVMTIDLARAENPDMPIVEKAPPPPVEPPPPPVEPPPPPPVEPPPPPPIDEEIAPESREESDDTSLISEHISDE